MRVLSCLLLSATAVLVTSLPASSVVVEDRRGVSSFSPEALDAAEQSGLEPERVLEGREIERRVAEAQAAGLPGIPVGDAYDLVPTPVTGRRGVVCVFGVNGD